jgi:glyoxylase-like metal-dependent hydrolase (beta-lactamase superfamily II)
MRHPRIIVIQVVLAFVVICNSACRQADDEATTSVHDNQQVENRGAEKDNWWDQLPRDDWSRYERIPSEQDWFEIYRLMDDVYAIYEPGQFEEVISFLIEGRDRALLFDTGLGIGDMSAVVAALTDLDVVVLNSHTHYDHIGGNHQFDYILGRDTDFTHARAAGIDRDAVAEFVGPGWVWKEWPRGFDPRGYRSKPFTIRETVDDGDTIDLGGRTLEVIATPGHTPDALCLIDRQNRLLLTGDTFYLAPLYTHLEGSDFEQYSLTAAKLANLVDDVDVLLTAHNVPMVPSTYLQKLGDAFASIEAGEGDYLLTDGNREYEFDDFSVIVRDGQLD